MHGATVPFFELLTLGLLLRALRRQRWLDYALAGLSAGFGMCFYFSFRLFPLVILFFLLVLWFTRPDFLRSSWRGLVVFAQGVLVATVPLSQLAVSNPDALWSRMETTSIFSGKTLQQGWQDVALTTQQHLLMFNYQGDPNGRHNLARAPMLDAVSAALLVLGAAVCLRRIRQPASFLMLVWLLIMLAPGIFSLDFESPQSYRSIGSLPAACLLALVPLQSLWGSWKQFDPQKLRRIFPAGLGLVLLVSGYLNYHTYFDLQANSVDSWRAFSTEETIISKIMNNTGDLAEYYVSVFFADSPTINFLAPQIKSAHKLQSNESIPLILDANKQTVFIMDADRKPAYLELKHDFPNAKFKEFANPAGKTVLYEAVLAPADIAAAQGLSASYYANADWSAKPFLVSKETIFNSDWQNGTPAPFPFAVEYRGVLYAPTYGNYTLALQSPGTAELVIDGDKIDLTGDARPSAQILLAQGAHSIRLRVEGKEGHFELDWKPPFGALSPIPLAALLAPPIDNHGLLGKYYPNDSWQGTPALARIDAWIHFYYQEIPLPHPFTVEWTGQINIPADGSYTFGLESIDQSTLWIDQKQVVSATTPNQYSEGGALALQAGLHAITLRLFDLSGASHVNLYWTLPGRSVEVVPSEMLFPPQGSTESLKPIDTPPPGTSTANPSQPATSTANPSQPADAAQVVPLAPTLLPVDSSTLAVINAKPLWQAGTCGSGQDQLSDPHGISLDGQGNIWVADTGNQRMVELNARGQFLASFGQAGETGGQFHGPFDLVVEKDGSLVVLDSESPALLKRYSPDGKFISGFGGDLGTYNPRGIGINSSGSFFIADTGTGRLLQVASAGALVHQWKLDIQGDNARQPVSVTSAADGSVYVIDAVGGLLLELPANGSPFAWQAVAPFDTLSGAHLVLGPKNTLYLTDPENKRVVVYQSNGKALGQIHFPDNQAGMLVKPTGITLGTDGTLFVADRVLCRVTAYGLPDDLLK